jgi:hypothetical protein
MGGQALSDEKFDLYYEAAEHSSHVFFLWTMDKITKELRSQGSRINYYSFLTNPLSDLDLVASFAKAEEQDVWKFTPLSDVTFLKNGPSVDSDASKGPRNVVYEFRSGRARAFLGTIAMINSESDLIGQSSVSFVLASSESSAMKILSKYYEHRRASYSKKKRVVDLSGRRLDGLQEAKWNEIFLPEGISGKIRNEVTSFFGSREKYKSRGLAYRRGILLGGSPGNGKTAICRAIASTVDVPVLYGFLDPNDIASSLSVAKETIVQYAPCVAIFEDADVFVSDDVTRGHVLGLMDGVLSLDGLLMVASTNAPEKLDFAFTGRPGRFDSYYHLPNPGESERKKILKKALGRSRISKKDFVAAVDAMSGLSAAFVQEVAVYALLKASNQDRDPNGADIREGIRKADKHVKEAKGLRGSAAGFGE